MSIAKEAFSPCRLDFDIYLIELREYQGADKFDIRSEIYTPLMVTLPLYINSSAYNVLVGKEMLFLSKDGKVRK